MLKVNVLAAVAGLAFAAAAQAQDNCADAVAVTNGSSTGFDTTASTNDGPAATCGAGSNDVWFTITVASAGTLNANCCGASYDSVIEILSGTCGAWTALGCNDDFCGLSSDVTAALPGAGTYFIRVMGFGGGRGTGALNVNFTGGGGGGCTATAEVGDAGELPATAQVPAGTGTLCAISGSFATDAADMYKITICDMASFSADTTNAITGTQDTQLYLFDENGNGVQMNDDATGLQSAMQNQFVTANGTYYLAVSHYDSDPTNAAVAEIWNDTPFAGVRAPDGAANGGDIVVAGWTAGGFTFNYQIDLVGVCFFEDTGCAADFNGDTVVDFFDYLDFVDAFSANDPSADFNGDTVIDFFDYLDFVDAFSVGC